MGRLSVALFAVLLVASLPALAASGAGADAGSSPSVAEPGEVPAAATTVADAGPSGPTVDGLSTQSISALDGSATQSVSAADENTIHREMTLRQLPERPGEFETELTLAIPDSVSELDVELESEADVEATSGFREAPGEATYEWTGSTNEPSLTFTMDANQTRVDDHDHGSGSGSAVEYYFAETGSWGVVAVPRASMSWRASDSLETSRSVAVDGPGAAGENVVVFGEVSETTREVRGETIRLVVSEAADPAESEAAVTDALAAASDALRVGARSTELMVAVVPTDGVSWAPDGLQYGDHDAWVADDSRLDQPHNVYLHEYAHSRQSFAGVSDGTTDATEWIVEGQADYYAAVLSLEQGLITYDEFRAFLERGQESRYAQGTLDDPDSWDDRRTDYARGTLVWGAIDYEVRAATDGERTAADVFSHLNTLDQPVTETDLLDAVERYGGAAARDAAERYTRTTELPDTWDHSDHQSLFEGETAVFDSWLADGPDAEIVVEGDYRSASFDEPPTVVPNETVRFPVAVQNVGHHAGPYDATLSADGTHADAASGTLDPGESTVEHLEWTPESTGTYQLRVGDEPVPVEVVFPEEATVVDLDFDPNTIDPGESTTAIVTVETDADVPAETTVTFDSADGEVAVTARVGPGETATADADLRFEEEGRYEITVDDQSATVGVGTTAALAEHVDSIPGFGAVGAVAALALSVLAVLALRRDGP